MSAAGGQHAGHRVERTGHERVAGPHTAVAAMAEVGIDISDQRPKVLTTDAVQVSDVVITMGCGDACPVFPGKRYLDWELADPAGKGVDSVRPIRDEIEGRIRGLLAELQR
ncbi:protein of unknown function [Modestobacter italicus]|uniref:Phosphotyrosine protein phosphatase I domain-containing protein n=2 Tax=Modestobacter italicus (strain DSM 44449 / CECT 9708 / BC 501) TaxID=2732864 RepID=I4EZ85_MODI5|nr:low molecular weight phosphatase family protein [Modestobacter marinus]CCH88698.1 protein of unknown function [Modestobacter marinus]